MPKPALGRGLGALLGGAAVAKPPGPTHASPPVATPTTPPASGERVERVPLTQIRPCPLQPRKDFSPEALKELADSIKERGIVQPVIVRRRNGTLELIAGERRFRAAQLLGLQEIPALIREADDREVLELALIENLQRENLNAIEEAQGYAQLVGQFGLTQEEVALRVGKSRAAVANTLRLLQLPASVRTQLRDNRISVGHAKVILGLTIDADQEFAAERVIKEGLNVRQTEALVARLQARANGAGAKAPTANAGIRDPHVTHVEDRLRERLGTKVSLRYRGGKGAVEISFFSDDELERLLGLLGVGDS